MKIAGEGDYVDTIHSYIEKKHLESKIKMVGRIDHENMPFFWRNSDVAVNISDFEGICLSNLEAMAEGCVPIITRTSAKEYIVDEENGFLISIGNYKKMAEVIKKIADNKSLLEKMGYKAYETIRENCTKEREIEVWKFLLEEVCE